LNFLKISPPIAIIGLGISGESALNLLLSAGIPRSQIATFDEKAPADFNDPSKLIAAFSPKTLVVSPGVPLKKPWIRDFINRGGEITSELSLACQVLTTERVIGITGSLGKSTVASILQAGLNSFSDCGFVGGNLGTPLSMYAAHLQRGAKRADWVVLELSSYNLENCQGLDCDFGAITYLTPNHLERYRDLTEYYDTKWWLSKITKDTLFLNKYGGDLEAYSKTKKTTIAVEFSDPTDTQLQPLNLNESKLLGNHNRENIALACRIALQANWPITAIKAMKDFPGLSHRVENIGTFKGVLYVNDSKATTMRSVLTAASSLRGDVRGTIHLLVGGRDKALPWHELTELNLLRPIKFYFFGESRSVARTKSGLDGVEYSHLKQAVEAAESSAIAGDLVLLSPGGTSLDEFKNFEDRGNFFRSLVQK